MSAVQLVEQITAVLNPADAARVMAALRQDVCIWQALSQPALIARVAAAADGLESWSPAAFALAALESGLSARELRMDPALTPPADLLQDAQSLLGELSSGARAVANLPVAGLAALVLRENFRLLHAWETVLARPALPLEPSDGLRTILACLYGLLPDPTPMLFALGTAFPGAAGLDAAVHCLLTNPCAAQQQHNRFIAFLSALTPAGQLDVLMILQRRAQPALAHSLAQALVTAGQSDFAALLQPALPEDVRQPRTGEYLARLQQAAAIHTLAGIPEQTAAYLDRAARIASVSLANCLVSRAAAGSQLPGGSWSPALLQAALHSATVQADLALTGSTPDADAALLEDLDNPDLHPLLALRQARLLVDRGDLQHGQDLARQAALRLAARLDDPALLHSPHAWNPVDTLLELVRLGLVDEAVQLAAAVIPTRPADVNLMAAAGRIHEQCGALDAALELAVLCARLAPTNVAFARRLAELYEQAEDWDPALVERERWLSLLSQPADDDLLTLAHTALKAGGTARARQLCEQVLSADPDSGSAHALLGLVCLVEGQPDQAVAYLSQATLLAPDKPRPWLHLAQVLRDQGQQSQSLDTLRAAVLAAPGSADLFFALGNACLQDNLPSEALSALREASRINPDSPDITAAYAEVLHDLGHCPEARSLLQQARLRWSLHARLAAVHGRTLMDAGDLDAALPALEIALKTVRPEPAWYLWYARALLHDDRQGLAAGSSLDEAHLEQAYQALTKAASLLGDNFEANVLMAEVLRAQKSAGQAYDLYKSLVDRPEACGSEWRWRIQAGFGQVSLALNQVDTAVAALREAAQARPNDLSIQHLLAEAYLKADLAPEAVHTARQALQLAPETLENLAWFIDIMTRLGLETETLSALAAATQLAPTEPRYWNRLATLQQRAGSTEAALASLTSLRQIQTLTVTDLQQAAQTYAALGSLFDSLACLERAVAASPAQSAELLYQMAGLYQQLGQPEEALDAIQKAIVTSPDVLQLHLLEADLLVWLARPEAARSCLEKALLLREKLAANPAAALSPFDGGWAAGGWLETAAAPAAVHTRLAGLLSLAGDLPACLSIARQGLDLQPDGAALRCLAVQSARGLLDLSAAADLLDKAPAPDTEDRWSQALTALRAELSLENDEVPQAARLIEAGVSTIPDEPHLLALQARLLARIGDTPGALDALTAAGRSLAQPAPKPDHPGPEPILWQAYQDTAPLSVAEAALDLEQWQPARAGFDNYAAAHPAQPLAHLRFARALVLCAERQQLCAELNSTTHAPGLDTLSPESEARCEQALEQAGNAAPVAVWKARARAVFQPGLQNAPALAKLPPSSDHAAALLAVLRVSKNAGNAVRILHHYPESPAFLLQAALCYRDVDPALGLDAARRAVEGDPTQPLNHAGLAVLAEAAGDLNTAAQSLEDAISGWPDEPEWHVWAANLSLQTAQDTLALAHWEKALALRPDRLDYALTLARLHLDHGNGPRAIEILVQASRVNSEEKSVWMTLAQAFLFTGSAETALECTARAAELDREDPAPLLLSGEISLQLGRPDQALHHARTARAIAPNDPEVVLFHARTLVQKGQHAEALDILEKSLSTLSAPSQPILVERAHLVHRLHGAAVALPLLLELAQIFPQDAHILTLLAQTQVDCGDLKGAGRTAYAAYHMNPELPEINLLLGRLQHLAGQLDQSIHFLSEAIRLSYGDADAYLDLGQAYLERREEAQALKTYQQAIQVSPRDHRAYYRAALVLRDLKDYVAAEAMLRRAAELAPEDLNIRRQLGAVVALNLVHNSQEVNSNL